MSQQAPPTLFDGRVRGVVARVLFENRDTGWSVFHLESDAGGRVSVVGAVAPVFVGETLDLGGRWENDRRYGKQFRAVSVASVQPTGSAGIQRYLASGVVPGIGAELARRLVARFGDDTLRVLDEEPDRLLSVRGIGAKRLAEIKRTWVERTAERQARIFLQGHGLGPALAERVLRTWGEETVTRVKRQPYALVAEVRGIGFRTADALAQRLGIAPTASERLRAGVLHVLQVAADGGHCYVRRRRLEQQAARLLELDALDAIATAVTDLAATKSVILEAADGRSGARVYLRWLQRAEARVARRLAALAGTAADSDPRAGERVAAVVQEVERKLGVDLAPAQREAVELALLHRVVVVTGGPGTGKTMLIDTLVRAAGLLQMKTVLAAPTGRAAKRIEQATGRAASTLHRLLEYRFDSGFGRGPDNPISADLIVVDEVSMVDLPLMDALLAAVQERVHLVLVGDADQLPPVGPGAVLRDLLASDCVPTVRLHDVYRQARASLIVTNAHRVNAGQMPLVAPAAAASVLDGDDRDFYIIEQPDAERALALVLRLATDRIPRRFGLDPMREVQVLSPMHRGTVGVSSLNAALQDTLNPASESAVPERPVLRRGDRVMQLRNDYDREVFNGDIGRVVAADAGGALSVEFDGRIVGYDPRGLADLTLAYAISVHKSQGSEYPAVIAVLLPEHRIMLQRNLLYTALTRAKRVAVLVTTSDALKRAVDNAAPAARYTTLAERLRAKCLAAGAADLGLR